MSTITSLKLGSVPITEEGVERYRFSDSIQNHFSQIVSVDDDVNCSVGRVFTKMKVPVSWVSVMNANYLIADMIINNPSGSVLHIKGWIDSIDMVSDSEDYPQVEIRWHFDYFEMFKSSSDLGYGHVKRRPFRDLATTPIQNYPVRYMKLDQVVRRIGDEFYADTSPKKNIWWVIVSYNYQSGGNTYIGIKTFPIIPKAGIIQIRIWEGGTQYDVFAPSIGQIYMGYIDEIFGIDPDDLNGIWLSPIPPFKVGSCSGSGDIGDPLVIIPQGMLTNSGERGSLTSYGWISAGSGSYSCDQIIFSPSIVSNEETRYAIVGPDGLKILETPYGFSVSTLDITYHGEPDGPYFEFTFKDGSYGNLEGMTANVPLSLLPANSNAYSSYIYSGQREYDKEMRVITSNANAWKSSAAGGGQGAMMGAFGAPGLALGVAGGVSGGLINYGVEMLYQNDEEQRLEDRLRANQASTLLFSSNSLLPFFRNYGFTICTIVPDDYSEDQLVNVRNNFGVSVDEILSSCDNLVKNDLPAGYYRIMNLIISGVLPKEAKDYIKNKFASGVKLL